MQKANEIKINAIKKLYLNRYLFISLKLKIGIVVITSDNLPVKVRAISHQSKDGFQNTIKNFYEYITFQMF